MMNRRREVVATFPSFRPGMFGWIAVHVHANKVAAQLQMMSHKDLVLLLDEELMTSSVGLVVPLKLDSDARTNGIYNETAKYKKTMMMMKLNRRVFQTKLECFL